MIRILEIARDIEVTSNLSIRDIQIVGEVLAKKLEAALGNIK